MKRKILQIDMTPFVDVGFLLIVFFMWLQLLQKPKQLAMIGPHDFGCGYPLNYTKQLTVYLGGDDRLYYRIGEGKPIQESTITGIRPLLVKWNKRSEGYFVVIKATSECTFKNVVDIIDEIKICNVKAYAFLGDTFPVSEKSALQKVINGKLGV